MKNKHIILFLIMSFFALSAFTLVQAQEDELEGFDTGGSFDTSGYDQATDEPPLEDTSDGTTWDWDTMTDDAPAEVDLEDPNNSGAGVNTTGGGDVTGQQNVSGGGDVTGQPNSTGGGDTNSGGTFTLSNPLKVKSIGGLVQDFIQIFSYIAVLFAVLVIIYIGFSMVMARGKPEETKKLKVWLGGVVIGVAVIIGARLIIDVVINTLSATNIVDSNFIQSARDANSGN
ncbi:MAG: pilin [Candidatus Paceibacterota bacterium]